MSERCSRAYASGRVKVVFSMLDRDLELLQTYAAARDQSIADYIVHAIATKRFIDIQRGLGGTILVEKDGIQHELIMAD